MTRLHSTPWAVIDYAQQPPVFRCTRCNGTAPLSLPVSIDQLTALSEAFCKAHAQCKPVTP